MSHESLQERFEVRVALLAAALAFAGQALAQGVSVQEADVHDQGQPATGTVYQQAGATLLRTPQGATALIDMPTPIPGAYVYPTCPPGVCSGVPGQPEVFTGWFIYFNHPELCSPEVDGGPPACGVDDVNPTGCADNPPAAQGGAVRLAGHPVSGPELTLAGQVSRGDPPLLGCFAFENVEGATVHLAVAPHGYADPTLLPELIRTPAGGPPHWWVAFFEAE